MTSIKEIILNQVENIANQAKYDMVYETNEADQLLVQIILRDYEGSIIGTPLSFDLNVDEEEGTGELVYYHSKGEFKRQTFNVFEEGSLLEVISFINNRLNISRY